MGYKLLSPLEEYTLRSCRVTERIKDHLQEEEKATVMAATPQHLYLAEVTADHFISVWERFDRHGESGSVQLYIQQHLYNVIYIYIYKNLKLMTLIRNKSNKYFLINKSKLLFITRELFLVNSLHY